MDIPVEDFDRNDRVTLLNGTEVVVESTRMTDGIVRVGWRSRTKFRKPHKLAGEYQSVGTFKPVPVGGTISVQEHVKR